jgi:hypothetical protein
MGFMTKMTSFARSQQGRKAMDEAKRLARDPKTKQQIEDVRRRLSSRGRKP